MAYSKVQSLGTEFAVDWDVLERFCHSYWLSCYQYDMASAVTMSESTWYNPFSWSLPAIKTVDVPWEKVRAAARTSSDRDMAIYRRSATVDMRGVAEDLSFRLTETARLKRHFGSYLRDVQSENMSAIDAAVDDYQGLIDASRFVRDTSADIVAIGSTIATGGAAAGLLGASSAMKGWGKYQDTGNVGAAALYGTGSLLLGAFKVGGAKLTKSGEYTLIVVQGVLESGTSLVAGDSFATALEKGGMKIASAGAAQALFSAAWVKQIFTRLPIPFNVWVKQQGKEMWVDEANELASKTVKKLTEKGVKAGLGTLKPGPGATSATQAASVGLLDQVPLDQRFLLHFSIVNMEKGIGRGW
ncbi:MAG: hypothetical protein HC882_04630 [Acidobacteria bacterium]|nr:hypothetical protein [Acidobacteriota bacterium]